MVTTWWEARATNFNDIEHPSFVAVNKQEQVILIGEVRGFPFRFKDEEIKKYTIRLANYLQVAKVIIPFAMLADVENILIFQWDGCNLSEPVLSLKTADVLNYYDPEFSKKQIFTPYLTALIEAWLRDLAYHWKLVMPSFTKEMADINLLQLLEGGTTEVY